MDKLAELVKEEIKIREQIIAELKERGIDLDNGNWLKDCKKRKCPSSKNQRTFCFKYCIYNNYVWNEWARVSLEYMLEDRSKEE